MNHKDYGFESEYYYHPKELELVSLSSESMAIHYQGVEIHQVHLPQKKHQKYFEAYQRQVEIKLHLIKPYLSGVESFLTMVSGLTGGREIEFFVKKEIYRL